MILSCPGRWQIVHEYAEVDTGIIWAIMRNEVPQLLENAESLLEESGHGR
jgi:uncharacterized protein with HEPN domain